MTPTDQLYSFIEAFLRLVNELLLMPILNYLREPRRNEEISITVNVNTEGSRGNRTEPPLQVDRRRSSGNDRPRVNFGHLEIRTYESILGDNPSCSRGPPLSIGWNYNRDAVAKMPVDTFESHPSRRDRPQSTEWVLLLDRIEREQTLLGLGYTKSEIAAATRQTLRDKRKRRQTADNLGASFMEEKVEGIKKSVKRNLLMKKGTKVLYKEWKKEGRSIGRRDSWERAHSILVLGEQEDDGASCGSGGHRKVMKAAYRRLSDSMLNGTASESSDYNSAIDDTGLHSTSKCKSCRFAVKCIPTGTGGGTA